MLSSITPPPIVKNQAQNVYERVRQDIVACRLMPSTRVKIADLVEQYEVSLGAVREALSRLTADGLVVPETHKGYRVAPVSRAELIDLTNARIEIECSCLAKAIERGDAQWEALLVAAYHYLSVTPLRLPGESGTNDEWGKAHGEYHRALVAGCGSPWLLRMRAILHEQAERYRRLSSNVAQVKRNTAGEHKALMEAALARNTSVALALVTEHIERTTSIVLASDL